MVQSPSPDIEQEILTNMVQLQKVSVELLQSMNGLTKKMDRMLSLFETAAQNIDHDEDGSMEKKLEGLLEQNKVIARGLVLIEKYIRDKTTTGFKSSALEKTTL